MARDDDRDPQAAIAAATTVLLLTAGTGAGHDSTAEALAEALHATQPHARVRVYDALRRDGTGALLRTDRWYDLLVAHAPLLWGLFYRLTDREGVVRLGTAAAARLWERRLRDVLDGERPDLVVSLHPLCARLAEHVLCGMVNPPPHHCVVTDLVSVHRCWAVRGVAAFYVATTQAAAALVAAGIPPGRVCVSGLPVRRAFTVPPSAPPRGTEIAVLILGGGRATHTLERAVCALLASRLPLRLVVVCGRNERLRRRLSAAGHARATVLGWRDDVAALMRASDVVVTKAGSATLAEVFSQARPMVTYQALPGQEEGNVTLVERLGLGRHVADMAVLPAAIAQVYAESTTCCSAKHARWWAGAAARVAGHVAAAVAARAVSASPRPRIPIAGLSAPPDEGNAPRASSST
jgi:UDP-N-acetylglucosamine:LPS N-acetylglucosamine transferase